MINQEFLYYDLLTGTYTREKLYQDLNKLIRNNQKFIVMYIDLNNFKEINDSFGHLAGDKVLEAFGEKVCNLGDDIKCYRMGGDEFVIIAGIEESTTKKLDEFLNSSEFNFSYGVSEFLENKFKNKDINDIIENLIVVADSKMYKRKLSSR